MRCYDGHSVWVNTKALELAGITRDTPDPPDGTIVRDPRTGEATGHLKEAAVALLAKALPRPTEADQRAAIRAAVAHASRFGITTLQNAGGSIEETAADCRSRSTPSATGPSAWRSTPSSTRHA